MLFFYSNYFNFPSYSKIHSVLKTTKKAPFFTIFFGNFNTLCLRVCFEKSL